jgi:hypothetical protein
MNNALLVVPEWRDFEFTGRAVKVKLADGSTAADAAAELDSLARSLYDPNLYHYGGDAETKLALDSCDVILDFATSPELAALLLRSAANHLRWAGISGSADWVVMTDPHSPWDEFNATPTVPRLQKEAVAKLAKYRADVSDPSALYGLPLSRAVEGRGWSWLEAAVYAGHVPHFEGIELAARATFELFAHEIENAEEADRVGDAVSAAADAMEMFERLGEFAHQASALFATYSSESANS